MRMRRLTLAMVFVLPIGLLAAGFATLALAEPSRQLAEPSGCAMDLRKWVEPESLVLGETAQVSLLVSSTCPTRYLPVDLIIVADESNSMIRAKRIADRPTPGEPTKEATPNPSAGPPTKPPTEPSSGGDPGGTPPISGGRGSEPPFCKPSGGSVREPTEGPPTKPPTRDPETPEPPEPPSTPGPITTPGGNPIVDPPPTPIDIEDLEPSGGTDWVREEKSWIRDFMTQPEIERDVANGRLRVGFVSFNERARIRQPLTTEVSKIFSASTKMRGGEITYPQTAIRAAEQMLRGGGSRKDVERVQIILLMSDFQFCQKDVRRADKDIKLIGVGFGVRSYDLRKMYDLVNERAYAFTQHRDLRGVIELYEDVVAKGSAVDVADLTVRDKVSDNIAILSGPIDPPTVTITGQLLEWSFVDPVLPMTLSYAIEPLDAGLLPVSQEAGVDWRDSETLLGGSTFPTVTIEVLAPTPTPTNTPTITPSPTATDTPTATHTPTPAPQFFPIALREKAPPTVTPVPSPTECVPSSQLVDVALVIDTSTSMNESTRTGGTRKLDAAIDAGIALVELLKDTDQSTVVWFNSNAGVSAQLTTNKSAVIAALRALPSTTASGTAMHLGIRAATDELTSSRHNLNANRSLILLTDGYQSHPDGLDVVYQAATAAKQADILVVTVGLGLDVDHAMLTEVASEPALFFHAPNAEDLEAIYVEIADLIPCR